MQCNTLVLHSITKKATSTQFLLFPWCSKKSHTVLPRSVKYEPYLTSLSFSTPKTRISNVQRITRNDDTFYVIKSKLVISAYTLRTVHLDSLLNRFHRNWSANSARPGPTRTWRRCWPRRMHRSRNSGRNWRRTEEIRRKKKSESMNNLMIIGLIDE